MRRYWMIGGAVMLIVMAFVTVVTLALIQVGSKWVLLGDDTDHPTTAQIEKYGWFRLPHSARNIDARLAGFQDHALWVRFEIDPSDEHAFWTSTRCAASPNIDTTAQLKAKGSDYQLGSGPSRPWWTPLSATRFTVRTSDAAGSIAQTVLIDRTNPAVLIVYVCCTKS